MKPAVALLAVVLLTAGIYWALPAASSQPQFVIYTYSSFQSDWGPGPLLKKEFERDCNCRVQFRSAGDANLILRRLEMEKSADLVIGLDQFTVKEALQTFEWLEVSTSSVRLEQNSVESRLIPYDWAPMTFVTRSDSPVRWTMKDVLQSSLALQDPRSSSPGLQMLMWLADINPAWIGSIKKMAHSVSPGWSTAYGLFQSGEAEAVFSYTTSPVYHIVEENRSDVVAVEMDIELPVQVEYMGIPLSSKRPLLAQKFVEKMLSVEWQQILMEKNYMLPVNSAVPLNEHFQNAKQRKVKAVSLPSPELVRERIQLWLAN